MIAALSAAAAAVAGVFAAGDLLASLASRRSRPEGDRAPLGRFGALAGAAGRIIGAPAAPPELRAQLAAAGIPARVSSADVMATKVGVAATGAILAVVVTGQPDRRGIAFAVAVALAGFRAPDVWLRRRARERSHRAQLELPGALDLLRVAVEAGQSPARALAAVGERSGGIFAAELRGLTAAIALGERPERAYARLAERIRCPPMAALSSALVRADRHGTPLAPALAALAVDVRSARSVQLEERAARAVPRMQLVIALVLVPAVLALFAAVLVSRI